MSVVSPLGRTTEAAGATVRRRCDSVTVDECANVEQAWDRREFIGTVAVTTVATLVPTLATGVTTTSPATAEAVQGLLADWTIDDMFGVWPRYADPIPHGRILAEAAAPDEPLDAL